MSGLPLTWFILAQAYLYDAAVLNAAPKPPGGFYGQPVRFLYFHSIELFLKAYLRLQGIEENELSKQPYGHSLINLADKAECQGLLIGKRVRFACNAARDFDNPMETRYIKAGWKWYVPAHKLHEAARELQSRVGDALRSKGILIHRFPQLPIVHPPRPLTYAKAVKLLARFLMIICLNAPAIAAEKGIQLSQENKDKLAATAQKLALCGGVYDMVSEIHKVTNSPALSLNTHEIANGAEIAAAFLLASTGIIPDWQNALKYAQNTRSSERTRQAALFKVAGNSPEKIDNAAGNLTEVMKECNIYGELQTELVQKAKLWIYSNQPKR